MKTLTHIWVDELTQFGGSYYFHIKAWHDSKNRKIHTIGWCGVAIRQWLKESHSQYQKSPPEWWEYADTIHMTDKLYVMLLLKFG